MTEYWEQVHYKEKDWPYEVSNYGRVRRNGRVLKPYKRGSKNGNYNCVKLCVKGRITIVDIHRLVAIAFIENPLDKPEVNHLDRDHYNCRVDNLEWCTRSENMKHRYLMEARI